MANKMITRLTEQPTTADLYSHNRRAKSEVGHHQKNIGQMRPKFEDKETEIIQNLYEVHFQPRFPIPGR